MASNRFPRRPAALASLIVTLATCGLTACGGSSNQASQARAISPQEAAAQRQVMTELISCARRHGVHLPPPTPQGVNVSGVRGRRNEEAVGHCFHKALKKAGLPASAGSRSQAEREREAAPPSLGEESPAG